MKKLLSVLLAALLLATAIPLSAVSVSAETTTGTAGDLTYKIVDDTVTITKCDPSTTGSSYGWYTIPSSIAGYPVRAIADYAFSGCSLLESIWLPDNGLPITIGKYAFRNCTSLKYVQLECTTSIGEYAFYGCTALTSIKLGNHHYGTIVNSDAFSGCTALTEIKFLGNAVTLNNWAFWRCTALTYVSIPKNVTINGNYVFSGCSSLTDVYYGGTSGEMPSGLSGISGATYHYSTLYGKCGDDSSWTFHTDISKLVISGTGYVSGDWGYLTPRYVIIEEGITGVGSTDFAYTYGDVYVLSLPSTLTSIGSESFMCGARTVILNGTKGLLYGGVDMCADGYLFFHNTTVLHSDYPVKTYNYYYTDTITLNGKMYYVSTDDDYSKHSHTYRDFSMDGFTGIQCSSCKMPRDDSDLSYKLEGNEITINDCLYNYSIENGYPTEVTIPDTILGYPVTTIGNSAFYYCKPLTSVTIGDSVTTIGDSAFSDCSSLTSVTIPEGVTSIGNSAFNGCSSLMNIEVDADNAFYYSLDGVLFDKEQTTLVRYPEAKEGNYIIPDSVTSIGDYAFYGCDSLTSVTIGDSVTSIGKYAFYDCDSLTSVTIPDSVTAIGKDAFCSCSSLTSVTIPDSVTSIGEWAFAHCASLTSVTIGDSVTSIGEHAFYYCDSLTSVTIPNSVTSIGEDAFYGCDSLTDVYYYGSRTDKGKIAIGRYNTDLSDATWHYNYTPVVYGDANGDGSVNAREAAMLQQYVAGWDVTLNEASADTNGDGSVNARDAAILQQYVAGWDVTLGA